jgi:preprotein translocase subunit YajC
MRWVSGVSGETQEDVQMNRLKTGLMVGMAGALLPAMAFAQTVPAAGADSTATTSPAASASTLAAGVKVLDTAGGTVGSIESIDGDFAVLATAKSRVRLPKSSFAMGPNGPVIAMTADQLDQAVAQAAPAQAAAAKPNVVAGAAVSDMQGGAVGTIADVNTQFATVQLSSGGKVRLPVTAFGAGMSGGLRIAMTAQQLSAAASAAPSSGPGHSK